MSKINLWNVCDCDLTTNNYVEAYHRVINSTVPSTHGLWPYMKFLGGLHQKSVVRYEQYLRGDNVARITDRSQVQKQQGIRNILLQYKRDENASALNFLMLMQSKLWPV